MEQNNFENDLRKKLNGMKLVPPETVWAGVEKHLDKKGRRKKLLFLLLFLTVLFTSGIYLYQKKDAWHNTEATRSSTNNKPIDKPAKENTAQISGSNSFPQTATTIQERKNALPREYPDAPNLQPTNSEKKYAGTAGKQKIQIQLSGTRAEKIKRDESEFSQKPIDTLNHGGTFFKGIYAGTIHPEPESIAQTENNVAKSRIINIIVKQPGIKIGSVKENTNKAKQDKSYRWNWGLNFSGGISSFISGSSAGKSSSSLSSGTVTNPGPGSNISYAPSDLRNSVGLSAGLIVKKKLAKRIEFSTGLNYKYYSLSSEVGQSASGTTQSPFFNNMDLYLNAAISQPQHYSNRFHFIELPVSLSLQLGKVDKLPLNFEIGVNIMRLLATNALQYEDSSSIYYLDNSLFQKTQSGFHTGFYFTLFAGQKLPVDLGPFFEYNFTPLAGKGLYQNRRISYLGLKADILFFKK